MTSLFSALKEQDETQLYERYEHLVTYAEMLGINDVTPLMEQASLPNGITSARLDHLQYLIESHSSEADELVQEEKQAFEINSTESLDWYLKKRFLLHFELEGVKAQYKKLINSIESQKKSLDFMFEKQAEDFVMQSYKATGKKTLVLPHGTGKVATRKPGWKVEDEDALQDWLARLTDVGRERYKVEPAKYTRDLDAIKRDADDQPIPGLVKDPGGDTVSLSLPKE